MLNINSKYYKKQTIEKKIWQKLNPAKFLHMSLNFGYTNVKTIMLDRNSFVI